MTRISGAEANLPSSQSLGLERLVRLRSTTSTMDDAHLAASSGAKAGTLIVADAQTVGRGRGGKSWMSEPNAGLWMTLVERPSDGDTTGVLALRVGIGLAAALDAFVESPVRLKWPNDLYVGHGKLAGILIEARWRQSVMDWVAIGVGVNMRVPEEFPDASCVRRDVSRAQLLSALVPAMRRAARATGPLTTQERDAWLARDVVIGRAIAAPIAGVAVGLAADGALLVRKPGHADDTPVRTGSIEFAASDM